MPYTHSSNTCTQLFNTQSTLLCCCSTSPHGGLRGPCCCSPPSTRTPAAFWKNLCPPGVSSTCAVFLSGRVVCVPGEHTCEYKPVHICLHTQVKIHGRLQVWGDLKRAHNSYNFTFTDPHSCGHAHMPGHQLLRPAHCSQPTQPQSDGTAEMASDRPHSPALLHHLLAV